MTCKRVCRRESAELWKVVLGLNNLDHPGAHSQSHRVRSIIVHPRYNRAVVDYDISVVQLDSEVRHTHTHTRTHSLNFKYQFFDDTRDEVSC